MHQKDPHAPPELVRTEIRCFSPRFSTFHPSEMFHFLDRDFVDKLDGKE